MGVYTFVVKGCDGDWSAKQLKGDLEASAASTYELQRKLVHAASASAADSSSGVQSSFSFVSPSSAVFQVIIGGAVGGGFVGGGAAAPAPAPAGGAPAAEAAPAKEEKKEEKKEESDDEDFGMSLFD